MSTEDHTPPTTADPLAVLEPVLRDVYQRIRDVTRDNLTDRCDAADAILRLATENAELRAEVQRRVDASADAALAFTMSNAELLGIVRDVSHLPKLWPDFAARGHDVDVLIERARAAVAKLEAPKS